MSDLVDEKIEEALRKDDHVDEPKLSLSKFPKLSDDIIRGSSSSANNLLLIACEHGNHQVAKEIAGQLPELAMIKNQHDQTARYIVSERGDVEMVQFLGEQDPESCLVDDNLSTIPLYRAAMNGQSVDVIRALVSICPESLEKLTSNQDTALHLAVKNSHLEAFQVLVNETRIHNKEHIFNWKNEDGNTVLHLATLNKSIEIVKVLALGSSNSSPIMKRVNTMNKQGLTALEVCKANYEDSVFKEIGLILQEASARFPVQQSPQSPVGTMNIFTWNNLARWPIEKRNLLLMIVGTIAAVFFTVICNLPAPFLKEYYLAGKTLHVKDVISGGLPTIFYLMVFNSAGFMTTMAAIVVLGWPLNLRTIMLFLVTCVCMVYVIIVDELMPKFFVRVGKSSISSIALMWSLVLALIFFGISILSLRKYTPTLCWFIHWLWTKRTIYRSNTLHQDLNA